MGQDNGAGNGKSESLSALFAACGISAPENIGELFFRNATAGIGKGDDGKGFLHSQRKRNFAVRRRELGGIVQQIFQRAEKLFLICHDAAGTRRDIIEKIRPVKFYDRPAIITEIRKECVQ